MVKVLIVVDEAATAPVIAAMLRRSQYEVTAVATTGEEAIRLTAETWPDILLMDLMLTSDLDSISTAQYIHDRFNLPIIYLATQVDLPLLDQAQQTQPAGYLVKPITEENLREALETGLERHRHRQFQRINPPETPITISPPSPDLLLRSIGDGVIATNASGQVTFLNPAAEAMTGWNQRDAIGQPITTVFRLVHEETWKPIEHPVVRAMLQQQVVYLEEYSSLVARNGTRILVGDSASPIFINGQTDGAVMVFWDVSQRRPLRTRNHLLQQEQQLKRLRDRFTNLIAQQFRTPLEIIMSSAGLLQLYSNQWSRERNTEYFEQIEAAVEQMNQLLEATVVAARTEGVDSPFDPQPLDLVQCCQTLIQSQGVANAQRIAVDIIGDPQMVAVDHRLLRHILKSLLVNALQYSAPDTPVELGIHFEQVGQNQIILTVQDQGRGIPEADQPLIFEPFYRGENISDVYGYGLGLALVKRCVELHNGTLEFDSRINQGTQFTVILFTPPSPPT